MGLLGEYYSVIEEGPMVIARNVLLIMMLAVGKNPRSSLGPKALSESVANTSQETSRQFGAAGFTLIETMLVIALIGILASLVISSLGGVREFAKRASSLSNLRTHAVAATAYAGDFKDLMPYATSPTARWSVLRCPSKNIAIKVQYFEMMNRWNVAVADGYYGGSLSSKIFISPLNRFAPPGGSGVVLGTDYWYSCAFLASPEFYNESSRMNLPGQLRAVKISEIVFPQYKTVFTDDTSSIVTQIDEEGSQLVAFADGHAARGSTDEDLFYQGGDGIGSRETHGGHFPGSTYPLLHTRDGVRGRDVK
jgi:prepilin-type N-terminal cleavage/methylation domain-containing protein